MNNKGFTLVEIIAVIAILGIIMSLSISSYVSYSEKLEEKNKENSLSIVKMKAKEYYNSTGKTTFFIKELITKGYLKTNQDNKYIVNQDDYTCHIVSIETSTDSNNKVIIDALVLEDDYTLKDNDGNISYDEEGYINCNEESITEMFSLSINNNIVTYNIPENSNVTVITNLGDYAHQQNNTSKNQSYTLTIGNISNVPQDFLIVVTATLETKDDNGNKKITTKKISVKASELNKTE